MQKRDILWWMILYLLICNTLVTLNINIAIVSMVNYSNSVNENENTSVPCPNTTFYWGENEGLNNTKLQTEDIYNWNSYEQNKLLFGYYWFSWLAILLGAVLAQKFGSKIVLGYSQITSSLMSSLIPVLAHNGAEIITYIRAAQGTLSMIAIPGAMLTIIGNWSPLPERGKFASVLLIGSTAGFGVGSMVFGYIGEYYHWKYIFHLTSVCGLIWAILWYFLIYDTPEEHPTITKNEVEYISNSLKNSEENDKVTIPWKAILTSYPFILSSLALIACGWNFCLLSTYTPSYLKSIYGLNTNQIGIINSIPQYISGIGAYGLGFLSDSIVNKGLLSITNSRKLFTFLGCIGSSIPLIVLAYTKCDVIRVTICIILITFLRNLNVFGVELVLIDISPKFCGLLQGISGISGSLIYFIPAMSINYLSIDTPVEELWKIIFYLQQK
ncbi:hypothetical protein PGB90_006725 [Kerria lacca]